MSKFQGSIDLQKLPGAKFVRLGDGSRNLVIPVDNNPTIVVGAKGIYLNIFIGESKNNQYGNTNYVVPSVSTKEEREALSEERRRELCPIIGNLKIALPQEGVGQQAVDLNAQAVEISNDGTSLGEHTPLYEKAAAASNNTAVDDPDNDLPF